jgi:hypothetical protein
LDAEAIRRRALNPEALAARIKPIDGRGTLIGRV